MSFNRNDTPPTQQADSAPSAPTTPAPSGTPGTGGLDVRAATIPLQDLSGDKLTHTAPRTVFNGVRVPALGGIPLIAKLGQGGMGAVYYGIHPRLHQEVAVKVLPFEMAEKNPESIQRFFREAQLAARVKSPHLVSVMDVNEENGLTYLVMEFVSGISAQGYLRELLKTRAKGADETIALDICIAACTGLAAAHAKGVIHRDVKPDNIMIPCDSQTRVPEFQNAKLADLGLARSDTVDLQAMTHSGACMGTPGFLAPEQAEDAKSCRKPADIFAMGATLYALLTGHSPFAASELFKVLKATIEDPHKPVRTLRPDVSERTARLIDRCLQKNPDNRYADAAALLVELTNCRSALNQAAQLPLPASRPVSAIPVAPDTSRNWLWLVPVLFISAGVAGWCYWSKTNLAAFDKRLDDLDHVVVHKDVPADQGTSKTQDGQTHQPEIAAPKAVTFELRAVADAPGLDTDSFIYKSKDHEQTLLLKRTPVMDLSALHSVSLIEGRDGGPQIGIIFTPEGTKLIKEFTTANIGKQIGIVLDGKLVSAPVIREAVVGGSLVFFGNFSLAEASELTEKLKAALSKQ